MQMEMSNQKRLAPIQGEIDNCFERLKIFIGKFNSQWYRKIEPTSERKIKELLNLLNWCGGNINFPPLYLEYLLLMGENDGGLLSDTLFGDSSVDSLIDLYRDYKIEGIDTVKNNFINFFKQDMGGQYSLVFNPKYKFEIYETDDEMIYEPIAENYEKLLFQCAVKKFVHLNKSYKFAGSKQALVSALKSENIETLLEKLRLLSGKYRLEESWISDFKHYVAFGDDMILFVEMYGGIKGRITGIESNVILKFLQDLRKVSGFTICEIEI